MKIIIPGEPIAKARPKFSTRGKFATAYDPQDKLKKFSKNSLKRYISENYGVVLEAYFRLPLSVSLAYYMPIRKSVSNTSANAKLWGLELPNHKPDIDNLIKWTGDIANGILWHDDAQIVSLSAYQIYSKNPCTIITIETINEVKMAEEHEKVFKLFSPQDCEIMSADAERIYMSIPPNYQNNAMYESQMAAAAELLIDFAEEWSDKLKKIKRKA